MNFDLKKIAIAIFIIILVVVLIVIFGKKSTQVDPNFPTTNVTLKVWGWGDENGAFVDIFKAYEATIKTVKLQYTKFDSKDGYEKALINAMASNTGPDIFMIDDSWVSKHSDKMMPEAGTLMNAGLYKTLYPEVVSKDMILSGYVYGAPLYMDAMALLYNKDIFNTKSIIFPPTSWDEFVDDVIKIREVDQNKKIQLVGTALGGATNVDNLGDILSVLAIQSGGTMNRINDKGVDFGSAMEKGLSFYMQFSDPVSTYYSWNESFAKSREMFASQKVGMILDYFSAFDAIKKQNPFLNIDVATLPQLKGASAQNISTVAKYKALAVSKQSKYPYVAWHFIKFMTTQESTISLYLTNTGRLPALKTMINAGIKKQENDVFLKSFLQAKTWQKADYEKINLVFRGMILDILSGKVDLSKSLKSAGEEIDRMY